MKLHTNDLVVIISGKDKGKTGRILRVLPDKGRVVVAGANMRTRHIKKTPQQPGRTVRYEASLDRSNVMIVDPKSKKRARIGYRTDEAGKKDRIARQSGEVLMSGRALAALADDKDGEGETMKKTEKGKDAAVSKET